MAQPVKFHQNRRSYWNMTIWQLSAVRHFE